MYTPLFLSMLGQNPPATTAAVYLPATLQWPLYQISDSDKLSDFLDVRLIVRFDFWEDQRTWPKHPIHVRFGVPAQERLHPVSLGRTLGELRGLLPAKFPAVSRFMFQGHFLSDDVELWSVGIADGEALLGVKAKTQLRFHLGAPGKVPRALQLPGTYRSLDELKVFLHTRFPEWRGEVLMEEGREVTEIDEIYGSDKGEFVLCEGERRSEAAAGPRLRPPPLREAMRADGSGAKAESGPSLPRLKSPDRAAVDSDLPSEAAVPAPETVAPPSSALISVSFSVRVGPMVKNIESISMTFTRDATIAEASEALSDHHALKGFVLGFVRHEMELGQEDLLAGDSPIQVFPIVRVRIDREIRNCKLFSGKTIKTVGDLLDSFAEKMNLPRGKIFLSLSDSMDSLREDQLLRSFPYGNSERVFVLRGIEFDDYTFCYKEFKELQRLRTDLRLGDVRLEEKAFLKVLDRVYIVNDEYVFDSDRLLSDCSGGPILILNSKDTELLTFLPFSGRSISHAFSYRAKCREALAFLEKQEQFRAAKRIQLYFDSSELDPDAFLLVRAKISEGKEFRVICTRGYNFSNLVKKIPRGGRAFWSGDFRDDDRLSEAKIGIENAWSAESERVEIEFADHSLDDCFGLIKSDKIEVVILDPEFEFEFPDGRRERHRFDQEKALSTIGPSFPDQIYDFFDDSGGPIDPGTKLQQFRGRLICLRIQYTFQSDCAIVNPIRRSFTSDSVLREVVGALLKKDPSGTVVSYGGTSYGLEAPISSIPYTRAGLVKLTSPYPLRFEVRENPTVSGRFFTLGMDPTATVATLPLDNFAELSGDVICELKQTGDRRTPPLAADARLYSVCSADDCLVVSQQPFRTCDIQHYNEDGRDSYSPSRRSPDARHQIWLTETVDAVIERIRPPELADRDFIFQVNGGSLDGSKLFVEVVKRDSVAQLCLRWRMYSFVNGSNRLSSRLPDLAKIKDARLVIHAHLKKSDAKLALEQIEITGHSDADLLSTFYRQGISFDVTVKDPNYHFPPPINDRRFPRATAVDAVIGELEDELEQMVDLNLRDRALPGSGALLYDVYDFERAVNATFTRRQYSVAFPDGRSARVGHTKGETVGSFTAKLCWDKDRVDLSERGRGRAGIPAGQFHVRLRDSADKLPRGRRLWPLVKGSPVADDSALLVVSFDVEVAFESDRRMLPYVHEDSPERFEYAASELFDSPVALASAAAFADRRLAAVPVVGSRHALYRFSHKDSYFFRRFRATALVREALAVLAAHFGIPWGDLELLNGDDRLPRKSPLPDHPRALSVRRRTEAKFRFRFDGKPFTIPLPLDATPKLAKTRLLALPDFSSCRELALFLFGRELTALDRELTALDRADEIDVVCLKGVYTIDGRSCERSPTTLIRELADEGCVMTHNESVCSPDAPLSAVCAPGSSLANLRFKVKIADQSLTGYATVANARSAGTLQPAQRIHLGGQGLPTSALLCRSKGFKIDESPQTPTLTFAIAHGKMRRFSFARDSTVEGAAAVALGDVIDRPAHQLAFSVDGSPLAGDERLAWVTGPAPVCVECVPPPSGHLTIVYQAKRENQNQPQWIEKPAPVDDAPLADAFASSGLAELRLYAACALLGDIPTRRALEGAGRRVVVVMPRRREASAGGHRASWLMMTAQSMVRMKINVLERHGTKTVTVDVERGLTFGRLKGKLAGKDGFPAAELISLFKLKDPAKPNQWELAPDTTEVDIRYHYDLTWIKLPESCNLTKEQIANILGAGQNPTPRIMRLYQECDMDEAIFKQALEALPAPKQEPAAPKPQPAAPKPQPAAPELRRSGRQGRK